MRYQPVTLALVSIGLVAACGTAPSSVPSSTVPSSSTSRPVTDLIDAALHSTAVEQTYGSWPVFQPFPHQDAQADCQIPQWQPPRSDGTDFTSIPGTCQTSVSQHENTWVIRFQETWDPARFRLAGERGSGPFEHTWEFKLDAAGQVVSWTHQGNFPPQFVHTAFH